MTGNLGAFYRLLATAAELVVAPTFRLHMVLAHARYWISGHLCAEALVAQQHRQCGDGVDNVLRVTTNKSSMHSHVICQGLRSDER